MPMVKLSRSLLDDNWIGAFRGLCPTPNAPRPWRNGFHGPWMDKVELLPYADLLATLNGLAESMGASTGHGRCLRFVAHDQCPAQQAYESWIANTGCVPTRDNLHDRYNALVWCSAPKTKARLNQLQSQAIAQQSDRSRRGPLRDATTLWDENLLVVVASKDAELCRELLLRHDWDSLFLVHRAHWGSAWRPLVFGHALLEKLTRPYKAITAHALVVPSASASWPAVDTVLAELAHAQLLPSDFLPIPVMGIPGWDLANESPGYYRDPLVFRPVRSTLFGKRRQSISRDGPNEWV